MSFLIFIAIIGVSIWWNTSTSVIDISPSEVSKISLFSGYTGKPVTITSVTDIQHIINNLNSISLKKDKISLGYMGYLVRIEIYKNDGEIYKKFIINSSSMIRKDPFFYHDSSNRIDYNYISDLIEKMPDARLSSDANTAKTFLESKGFKIGSYEGNTENYTLTEDKLKTLPYSMYWSVQTSNVSKFLNRNVHIEKFIVTNHPLDNWESHGGNPSVKIKSKGMTNVWVFVIDGKAIGGYSYPFLDEQLVGDSVWSLDGKTLEEINSMTHKE